MNLTDEDIARLEEEEKKRGGKPSSEVEPPAGYKGVKKNPLQEIVSEPVPGMLSDADIAALEAQHASPDDGYMQGANFLRSVGRGLGSALETVDKYTVAPVRTLIGEQVGIPRRGPAPQGLPGFNQWAALGENAPSEKEIAARLGMSEEETIPLPIYASSFTNKERVSPAGVVGGIVGTFADPFLVAGAPEKAVKAGANTMRDLGHAAQGFARERAVKAATGENRSAIRKLARVSGKGGGDVDRAIANLQRTGKILLEPDANFGGKPAIGVFDNSRAIADTAEARRKFYGKKIGEVGPVVDRLNPGAITPETLGNAVQEYAHEIPRAGKGNTVRNRVQAESDLLRQYGLAEDDIGPAPPLKFEQAQELKAQYPWEPQSPDVLISDKDASNRIHGIISGQMDRAVSGAKMNPGYGNKLSEAGRELDRLKFEIADAYKEGVPMAHNQELHDATRVWNSHANDYDRMLDGRVPAVSPSDMATLNSYAPSKQRYGTYKNIGDAGTEQTMRTLGRNFASPSTKAIGMLELVQGGSPVKAALYAAANQLVLSRGNAAVARGANQVGNILRRGAVTYRKWMPAFQTAAQLGNGGVLALHHQLMNNDPEYRAAMMGAVSEP